MHIQRIRFDRVFDIQPSRGLFSFESADGVVYSVHLPGRVIPLAGATWDVAFAQPGNWNTLLGWRDVASERITLSHRVRGLLVDQFEVWCYFGIPVLVATLIFGGPVFILALLLAWSIAMVWVIHRIMRSNRRVRAALSAT